MSNSVNQNRNIFAYPAILLMLIASGAAGLIYQVTWFRLIGLSLGSTSASVSTVLTAFFLGLALGSYLAERLIRGKRASLLTYVSIEVLIGLSGLASLFTLLNLDRILILAPAFGTTLILKFLLAVVLLIIPATSIGATFPVMAALMIRSSGTIGARISQLYAFNTLGAVVGAFASGFVIIPAIGLDGAILLAAALNFSVAATAFIIWLATRRVDDQSGQTPETREAAKPVFVSSKGTKLAAITLAITGFVSIATQVGWTKYLAIFTGNTIFGFSAILTVFLIGITLGSLLLQRQSDRIQKPGNVISVTLLALAASLLFSRWALGIVPHIQQNLNQLDLDKTTDLAIRIFVILVVFLPPTFILGALFPFNLKAYCGGLDGVRDRIGKGYAINTVAGIAGAIIAGFVAIPYFGTDALLLWLAILTGASALLWLSLQSSARSALASVAMLAVIALGGWYLNGIDYKAIVSTAGYDTRSVNGQEAEFEFLEEGKAGIVSLVTYDGESFTLQNNGLNESSFERSSANYIPRTEFLLGLLPYMLADDPKSAFVVGFGGGHTTLALTRTDLDRIKVAELEPAIVNAGLSVDSHVSATIADKRVELVFNDARNELLLSDEKFDVIAAQPSHPWVAGAANVFTRQFWQITRERLKPGGVMTQWVNLFYMDINTLNSIMKAFYEVYPQGMVVAFLDNSELIMIGSETKITLDRERVNSIFEKPEIASLAQSTGVSSANDLVWYYAFSRERAMELSENAIASTDTNIITEVGTRSGGGKYQTVEDPVSYVKTNAEADFENVIDVSSEDWLADLGEYFIYWDNQPYARHVADYLEPLNGDKAESLRFRSFLKELQFAKAFEAFDKHHNWDDADIEQHIEARLGLGMAEEALELATAMQDSRTGNELTARALFQLGRADEVLEMDPASMRDDIWYLLAAGRKEPVKAVHDIDVRGRETPEAAKLDTAILRLRTVLAEEDNTAALGLIREIEAGIQERIDWLELALAAAQASDDTETIEAVRREIARLKKDRNKEV